MQVLPAVRLQDTLHWIQQKKCCKYVIKRSAAVAIRHKEVWIDRKEHFYREVKNTRKCSEVTK